MHFCARGVMPLTDGSVDVRGAIIDADSGKVVLGADQSFTSSSTGGNESLWRGSLLFSGWPEVVRELSIFEMLVRIILFVILVLSCTWPFFVLLRASCRRRKNFGYSAIPVQKDSAHEEIVLTSFSRRDSQEASHSDK